jgi:hypothetical protein
VCAVYLVEDSRSRSHTLWTAVVVYAPWPRSSCASPCAPSEMEPSQTLKGMRRCSKSTRKRRPSRTMRVWCVATARKYEHTALDELGIGNKGIKSSKWLPRETTKHAALMGPPLAPYVPLLALRMMGMDPHPASELCFCTYPTLVSESLHFRTRGCKCLSEYAHVVRATLSLLWSNWRGTLVNSVIHLREYLKIDHYTIPEIQYTTCRIKDK